MTIGWIHESAQDRLWETGSDIGENILEDTFECKVCGELFTSTLERDKHELSHPVQNPSIYIRGKEITGSEIDITSIIKTDEIRLNNIEHIYINEIPFNDESEIINFIINNKKTFISIGYGNKSIDRKLNINICIADEQELIKAEEVFLDTFSASSFSIENILDFSKKVKDLKTIKKYSDSLFRYMQAVDKKNKGEFNDAITLFNQSTQSIKKYDRFLAHAIISIANFNRNDFNCPSVYRIPLLNDALHLITGVKKDNLKLDGIEKQLPIDHASEYILENIISKFNDCTLEQLVAQLEKNKTSFFSPLDIQKLYFIFWRKALIEKNEVFEKKYYQKIKYSNAFEDILREHYDS